MDNELLLNSSSSPNATSPPPLLRLSNELLDTIFNLAYDNEPGPEHWVERIPICRRVLPFQRAILYRRVGLYTYRALKLFHRTVVGSSACAELVRHLEIEAGWQNQFEADGSNKGHRPGYLPGDPNLRKIVTPVEFATLVPRLSNLESLKTVELDPALLDVVFLDQDASRSLLSLTTLDFSMGFVPLVPPECDAGDWVQRVSCLPRLADLALHELAVDRPILPVMSVPPIFQHLTRLVLTSVPSSDANPWACPALDQMAPNLVELVLENADAEWFAIALSTAPVDLRRLSLINRFDFMHGDRPSPIEATAFLARFERLERLDLGYGALDVHQPSGLGALLALDKLQHLSFDDVEPIPDSFFLTLLAKPTTLPNLVTLELHHVYSARGHIMEEMRGVLPPFEAQAGYPHWPMWDGWHEPEYPDGCSEAGLVAVIRAAEARGIAVTGAACDALEWRAAFDAELRVALLALGDLTGEYRRAREVLGNAVVNAHILARARASVEGGEGGGA